jgi:hypothetical protein
VAGMRFVFSREVDFLAFVAPVLVACMYIPTYWTLPAHQLPIPILHFLFLVMAVDVGHVWATLFRTYFDTEAREKRGTLYFGSPPAIFAVSVVVHYNSKELFWTVASYMAIYHFMAQNYGLLALYKARCGERNPVDYRIDWLTIVVGAAAPVALWHASPTRRFDWFGDALPFVVRVPQVARLPILIAYAAVGLAWIARQVRKVRSGEEPLNHGKVLIMGCSWLTWGCGALIDHQVLSLAFLNLFHGVPSFVLVYFVCQRRYAGKEARELGATDRLTVAMTSPGRWPVYLAFLVSLAVVEELLWEVLVGDLGYLTSETLPPHLYRWILPTLSRLQSSMVISALALPQLTHYFLDAFIWKMDGSNPGLREALMGPRPPKKLE